MNTGILRYSSSDAYLYVDGTEAASTTAFLTDGVSNDSDSFAAALGSQPDGLSVFWNGQIAAWFVYSGNLSTSERAQVHSYIQDNYGIAVSDYVSSEPPPETTTQQLAPDAILAQENLTGTVAAVQDDPFSPDPAWLTAV